MGKSKRVTVGYRYYMGIHMGVCRGPVDELVSIKVGDRHAWPPEGESGATDTDVRRISAGDLFGGDKKEGGIDGPMDILMGKPDQVATPGLLNLLGGPLPGYRGMLTVFFDGLVSAMNPYPKKWAFRVRRVLKGWMNDAPWYPERAEILLADNNILAMNPAHILYECETNKEWGRGLDPSLMNEASFRHAADTLYAEKFGLCMKWSRKDSIESFVQQVIDHIGAVLYTDRESGLRTIKLIRNDYLASSLPHFNTDSGLLSVDEASVASLGGALNEIVTTYRDPITNEDRSVRIQNLAGMQASGGVIHSISRSYPGIPTAQLAMQASQRDLRTMASGLRRFKLKFDRRAWRIVPGDVIRISEPSRGIYDMVVRVGSVKDGTLTNGEIEVVAIQDVFTFPLGSYQDVMPPIVRPKIKPEIKKTRVFEIPYTWLVSNVDRANFQAIEFDAGYVGVVVEKPTEQHTAYDIARKYGGPSPDDYPDEEDDHGG